MKKVSEQLVGLLVVSLLITMLAVGFAVLAKKDHTKEAKMMARELVRHKQDSLAEAIRLKDSMRMAWAEQKIQRDSLRQIYALQKIERERQHALWAAEKAKRDSIRYAQEHIEIILQPFNPNTADSTTLVHLGFKPWMARSVINYRKHGGQFKTAEQVKKIYGMTDSLYQTIKPYIQIDDSAANATSQTAYIQKKDTVIELNTADTLSLQMLHGVGRYTAILIVRYREKLGGYTSPEQIKEIQPNIQNVEIIIGQLTADAQKVKPLLVNKLSLTALQRHPYISTTQATAIRDYRHKKGAILNESTLKELKKDRQLVFGEEEIERLRPYISYEE